jgi:hypothetical protein
MEPSSSSGTCNNQADGNAAVAMGTKAELLRFSSILAQGVGTQMATETDEFRHLSELGGPAARLGIADLLFAVFVVAFAAGWIALAALL